MKASKEVLERTEHELKQVPYDEEHLDAPLSGICVQAIQEVRKSLSVLLFPRQMQLTNEMGF